MPRDRGQRWKRLDPLVRQMENYLLAAECFLREDGLRVLISLEEQTAPGVRWLHASASFDDHTPSWDDMVDVKESFMGPDVFAVQMHPPRAEYVNVHQHTLHLWSNVLGPTICEQESYGGSP